MNLTSFFRSTPVFWSFFFTCILVSCTPKKTKIGFSQCTGGEWREQMNRQMISEISFYDHVELEIRNAEGQINKQIEDIHYFIKEGVDLIIISPFEDKALVDEFNKIDFKGIPILLVDRNISSNKNISFVGASNTEVGKMAANYVLKNTDLDEPTKVLHIKGYENSSATEEREKGFVNALANFENIEVVILNAGKDVDGEQLTETKKIIHDNLDLLTSVKFVYGFSDAMALLASDEAEKINVRHKINFIGVDGQLGHNRGLDAVKQQRLQATIVYPPGGDVAIETAMKIIQRIPVQKKIELPLLLIDAHTIDSYYQQEIYIQNFQNKIELLHNKTEFQLINMHKQKILFISIFTASIFIMFIAVFIMFKSKSLQVKNAAIQYHLEENLYLKEQQITQIEKNIAEEFNSQHEEPAISYELEKFKSKIDAILLNNYMNYNFSVSEIADHLSLSRMHLYRKFKMTYNDTPNNYIREYRLQKAVQLIYEGELNFSEIAYKVGFTSPAYFTKCFKEVFGCTPSEYTSHSQG